MRAGASLPRTPNQEIRVDSCHSRRLGFLAVELLTVKSCISSGEIYTDNDKLPELRVNAN
jgi:hypothetical protein